MTLDDLETAYWWAVRTRPVHADPLFWLIAIADPGRANRIIRSHNRQET